MIELLITFCVLELAIIGGLIWLALRDKESGTLREAEWIRREGSWDLERKQLLDRLMSRNWGEYVALKAHDASPVADHDEIEKTSNYDGAWASR